MDIVDPGTRSRMMPRIRDKDTKPELVVRSFRHRAGLRFRLHAKLPGNPDLALAKHRTVVCVHGCFWHRHAGCRYATIPASNAKSWEEEFAGNVLRDARATRQIEELGWRVEIVWSCQSSESELTKLASRIKKRAVKGDKNGKGP